MTIDQKDREKVGPGTKLVATYKGVEHTCTVRAANTDEMRGPRDKGLRFRLADGKEYRSPSSAASAITGKAANGWNFWSLATKEGKKDETAKTPEKATEAPENAQQAAGQGADAASGARASSSEEKAEAYAAGREAGSTGKKDAAEEKAGAGSAPASASRASNRKS